MEVRELAAQVMGLAQDGEVEAAVRLAETALPAAGDAAPEDQAAFWYAVSVALHIAGDNGGAYTACDDCVRLARQADSPGWASNGLSMRGMARARQGRVEEALLDLAEAERELAGCDDAGQASWAHTGLGYAYLELRLYELALPHMEQALALAAQPVPLVQGPVIDLMNLAELHLRWADELERVFGVADQRPDITEHRTEGHRWAERALAAALELPSQAFVTACQAMELYARPTEEAVASLDELRSAFDAEGHPRYQGGRAVAGGALARALWNAGRRNEALDVARTAAAESVSAGDWHVSATGQWLQLEMEAQSGLAGAATGRSYAGLLSRVLWQHRISSLHGAQAALRMEQLHHDAASARQAAHEDPLTGVGNRRALDEALRTAQLESPREDPLGLLLADLDDFKPVNDTHGHLVGDEVLRAVAGAIRSVARGDDLVARIGGDEFAVLMHGADEQAARSLAERVELAVAALRLQTPRGEPLRLHASVGVASAGPDDEVASLFARADAAMYAFKAARSGRGDARSVPSGLR